MKEYKVVKADTVIKLEREIEYLLRQGWTCVGGVSISDNYAFQAMVNEAK
jgi:hypothetical protein